MRQTLSTDKIRSLVNCDIGPVQLSCPTLNAPQPAKQRHLALAVRPSFSSSALKPPFLSPGHRRRQSSALGSALSPLPSDPWVDSAGCPAAAGKPLAASDLVLGSSAADSPRTEVSMLACHLYGLGAAPPYPGSAAAVARHRRCFGCGIFE